MTSTQIDRRTDRQAENSRMKEIIKGKKEVGRTTVNCKTQNKKLYLVCKFISIEIDFIFICFTFINKAFCI